MSIPLIILAAALLEGITEPARNRVQRPRVHRHRPRIY